MASQSTGMFIAETHTEAVTWFFSIDKMLAQGTTQYQEYQICEIPRFGKTLFLDHNIQSSLMDEYVFHECMTQPAMMLHPNPKKVAVCGGGEGATLWQALRHSTVEQATMVDIDAELVEMVKVHMPEWHRGAFEDPRTTLLYADAREWIASQKGAGYDVVLSDLANPHPGGPSQYLFTREFFQMCADAMSDDGVFALQAGSANENYPELMVSNIATLEAMKDTFAYVAGYSGFVTTFMMPWGFALASKKYDPLALTVEALQARLASRGVQNRYVTPRYWQAMFTLPDYLLEAKASRSRVLTDAEPYAWEA